MSGVATSEKKDPLPLEPRLSSQTPNHDATPSPSIKRSPSPRPRTLGVSSSVYEKTSPERREKHPMTSGQLGFLDGSSSDHLPLTSTYANLASDGRTMSPDASSLGPGQGSVPVTAGLSRNYPANVQIPQRPSTGTMESDRESSSGWSPAWSPAFDPSSAQASPVPPYAPNGIQDQYNAHHKTGSGSWGPYAAPTSNGGGVGLGMSMEEKNGGYSTFPLSGPGLAQPYNYPTMKEQPTRSWAQFQDSAAYWLGLYFFFNLGLTLFNKIVLVSFPFPYTLTGLHALSGCAGCYVALERGAFTPARLTSRENVILALFSVLYTINIAVSNISLQLVTVPFHQVVRASTPIFTILISTVILRTRFSLMKLVSLLPVVAGVGFATYGDYYFTAWGLILTLLGTFLAALKTVVTNLIQTGGGGRLKLHPLDLLMRMSPLAFIQCVVYGWYTGELERVRKYGATQMTRSKAIALLVNGVIACGLNIVSFTANKKAGALTMTVSANCKQVLTIALAVVLFDLHINFTNSIGIMLTLVGGAWYGWVEYQEKQKKNAIRLSEKS